MKVSLWGQGTCLAVTGEEKGEKTQRAGGE